MAEGGLLPPIIVELKAKATELKAGLGEARAELKETAAESEKSSSRMGGALQKTSGFSKALALGIGGAAVAVAGFGVEAAVAGEKADAQLATAIKNAGGNMEELEPKIKAVDSTMRQFGYTNEDTNNALSRLTVATKDPEKALQAVSVAADLARSRNIPLATATDLVAKAMSGQTGALTRMGISLPIAAGGAQKLLSAQQGLQKAQDGVNAVLAKYPDAATKGAKGNAQYEAATKKVTDAQKKLQDAQSAGGNVLAALSQRVHGAASAYGDTLAGKVQAAKAQLDNMGEAIGKRLIPILTTLLGWIMNVADWLGKHKVVLMALGAVVLSLIVPALISWATAAAAAAAATIAAAAPILAIIAAIAALAYGIYELVTHWTTVWNAIKDVLSVVWDFLKQVWSWISSIFIDGFKAYLGVLEAVWGGVWDGIKAVLSAVWDFLKSVWSWISGVFIEPFKAGISVLGQVWAAIWGGIKTVIQGAWSVIQAVGGWIMNNVIQPVAGAISWLGQVWGQIWGGISKVISDVGGVIGRILGGIVSGISTMIGWIQKAIGWFESLFSASNQANQAATNARNAAAAASTANAGFQNTIIGGNITSYKPSKDVGGWIYEAPRGQPVDMTGHGGEYVLSLDMLAGRQKIDPAVVGAISGQAAASPTQQALTGGSTAPAGGSPQVTVIAQTNASPAAIASQVGWLLRAQA